MNFCTKTALFFEKSLAIKEYYASQCPIFFQKLVPATCAICRALHRVPLDETWKTNAQKELKGKDVEKTLTWKTPEVSMVDFLKF